MKKRRSLLSLLLALLLSAGLAGCQDTAPKNSQAGAEDPTPGNTVPAVSVPSPAPSSPSPAPGSPSPAPEKEEDWQLRLVNPQNPLPEDFEVPELTQLSGGHAVDSRIYPSLQAMMDDARAAGVQPTICSSFRTWETQEKLFQQQIQAMINQGCSEEEAKIQAAAWVVPPGTSEHQTGLALDIVDVSYQILDEGQEDTPAQQWLMEHCAEYGFILRYPTDKKDITEVNYEPWHYRYVGEDAAREIMESGLCLEEYLAQS